MGVSINNGDRNQRLDNVKWILTLLMVVYHIQYVGESNSFDYKLFYFIKNFGECVVPAFAVISGFLFWRKVTTFTQVTKKMYGRIFSLLIPYLLWNLINVLLLNFITAVRGGFSLAVFDVNLFTDIIYWSTSPHFWYVFMLMFWTVVAPLLYLVFRYKPLILVLFASQIVYLVLTGDGLLASRFTYIEFTWGAVLGVFLPNLLESIHNTDKRCKIITIFLSVLVFFTVALLKSFFEIATPIKVWLSFAQSVAFIAFGLYLPLSYVGNKTCFRYSFWLFATHYWLDVYLSEVVYKVVKIGVVYQLLTFVLVTAVSLCIGFLVDKFMNPVFNLLNGNRSKRKRALTTCP